METTNATREVVLRGGEKQTRKIYTSKSKLTESNEREERRYITGEIEHHDYIQYLKHCHEYGFGAVISPDIVWFIITTELAKHIKDNVKEYAEIFTTTPDFKQKIIVLSGDPKVLPLDLIAEQLRKRVPLNVDTFIPTFSTSDKDSNFAFVASFADAVQNYYTYYSGTSGTCGTGYPDGIWGIKVLGNDADWLKLRNCMDEIVSALHKLPEEYADRVFNLISEIRYSNRPEFWKTIYRQATYDLGWIKSLFIDIANYGLSKSPYSIAIVPYKLIIDVGGIYNHLPKLEGSTTVFKEEDFYERLDAIDHLLPNYELKYGLFSSDIVDGYLVPKFGFVANEILAEPATV